MSYKWQLKSGVYESDYGNAVEIRKGATTGKDLDMGERIPAEMVSSKFIRSID